MNARPFYGPKVAFGRRAISRGSAQSYWVNVAWKIISHAHEEFPERLKREPLWRPILSALADC